MSSQRGFALVITLIITALLVALIMTFVDEVYVDTSLSKNFVAGQQASLLAESGVTGARELLKWSRARQINFSSLLDPWAKPLKFDDEQGRVSVTIEEESGKLNLNSVVGSNGEFDAKYHPIALRLLNILELPVELCDTLADWIDDNHTPKTGGAESNYYLTLQPPYGAKNAKLETVEELALVKGFAVRRVTNERGAATPLAALRPFVTVYGEYVNEPISKININTASKEVLMALDERVSDTLATSILDYRKTTPFKNSAELAKVPGMNNAFADSLLDRIKFLGSVYRIHSVAQVKEITREIEAVVRLDGTQQTILYWREF